MKRTLIFDFLLKLSLVTAVAFVLSFLISYFYLSNLVKHQQEESLRNVARFLLKNKFSSKGSNLKFLLRSFDYKLSETFLEHLNSAMNSDFVVLFDDEGKVEYSLNFHTPFLYKESYFNFITSLNNDAQILHNISDSCLSKKVVSYKNMKSHPAFSFFIPFTTDGKNRKKVLWVGFLLENMSRYFFEDIQFLGADVGFFLVGDVFLFPDLKNNEVLHLQKSFSQLDNKASFQWNNKQYIAVKVPLYDFASSLSGYIVVGKEFHWLSSTLHRYLYSILLIFIFSSLVGILFVCFYFRSLYLYVKGFLNAFDRIKNNDFSIKLNENYNIREFVDISKEFNNFIGQLHFYITKMEEKINSKTREVMELNRAVRILDKQSNFEMLVEAAINFLSKHLGFKVFPYEECLKKLQCSECHLKLIAYRKEDINVGLCVDCGENRYTFQGEFLSLFEDVFRINCERLYNIKVKEESYKESILLSDILLSILKKDSVQDIFLFTLDKAREFCKSDAAFIGLYNQKENIITLKFFQNIKTEEFKKLSFSADKGLGGLVIREKRGFFIPNYFESTLIDSPFMDIVKKEGLVSNIAVPIFYKEDVYGILYVSYRSLKNTVSKEMFFLEKLSYGSSLAIEKEMLLKEMQRKEEELRKAYDEIVSNRKELNDILKSYKETNIELERINNELSEQYEVIKKSYNELSRLNKAKTTFLGILSHELKTPVTILSGYIDTLLSGKFELPQDVINILNSSKKSLLTLVQIVEDALDYVRIESGSVKINKMPFVLKKLVETYYPEFEPYLKERSQKIIFDIKDDVIIKTDGKWFKQAFLHVILNAIKFSPDGKTIKVVGDTINKDRLIIPSHVLERPVESDKYTVIKVIDEGIGIDYGDLNSIFDKFYEVGDIQTHSTGRYKFLSKGLGMGLSFVKEVVKLHGGIIYAESIGYDPVNCPGTTFTLILPVGSDFDKEKALKEEKKQILVVEGESDIIKFFELVFSKEYKVHFAFDGALGYRKALEIMPDLIFININISKHDGYELCSMIKEDKKTKKIPVVLYVTGGDIDDMKASSVRANMVFSPIFDIDNLKRIAAFYLKKEDK